MFDFSGFSAMTNLDIYLRTLFFRVLSRMTVSNEECQRYWRIFPFVPVRSGLNLFFCLIHRSCRRSLLLLSGFSLAVWPLIRRRFFRALGSQISRFTWGSDFFGGTASLWWAFSLEVFSQASVLIFPWQRRSGWVASLISDGIFGLAVFPHFLWGVEY